MIWNATQGKTRRNDAIDLVLVLATSRAFNGSRPFLSVLAVAVLSCWFAWLGWDYDIDPITGGETGPYHEE